MTRLDLDYLLHINKVTETDEENLSVSRQFYILTFILEFLALQPRASCLKVWSLKF